MFGLICLSFTLLIVGEGSALTLPKISVTLDQATGPKDTAVTLQILFLFTLLTLAPAILIMFTSFARVVVVLSFLRQAIGTQQMPPNQIIIGLALFLTFFIMAPVWQKVNSEALQPYLEDKLNSEDAFNSALVPLRSFMFSQTREKDLALFTDIAKMTKPSTRNEIPTYVLMPAFIISELKTAFQIGFLIYLPFLVLDMVVASVLMSMGMLMLPPVMISLPFKLMLFVMVDGWNLLIGSLVKSFT
ncbi:MAG: flagellar type III secretion system pore protein FliP [Candidatus Tectomicrobia bacterium]|uniref:Flagellar biosynthetic protein FliP n=1 Tax=Tectimicrobiota bacterium TaxID=2528274 RepID=A0A933GNU6_UNCTE|nr:flagellar type III secretion system pore protein FliP [Candidatus Tectomicrobia bacterium]